jgi:hypothetical protein
MASRPVWVVAGKLQLQDLRHFNLCGLNSLLLSACSW